ncbi:MAG TPA: Sec-independent protein translocase protein TatB [Rhodocyclaceae bacterium]|nr:Sec-independent protein translocase protein TatB [Rhodocyclaceae bacterium]
MFDIGFSELIVIALVALIVIGPEKLPKVARTAGALLGRLQRYVSDVKSDIQREMQIEDLKRLQQQVEESARSLEVSVDKELREVETSLNKAAGALDPETPALPAATEATRAPDAPPVPAPAAGAPQMELELGQGAPARKAG